MSKDCVMTSLPCMIVYLEVWITIEINLSSFIIQQTIENGLLDNVSLFLDPLLSCGAVTDLSAILQVNIKFRPNQDIKSHKMEETNHETAYEVQIQRHSQINDILNSVPLTFSLTLILAQLELLPGPGRQR